jgi:UvrD-like helicase C-terminal domain/Nuclease-related domain/AAA domain
MAHLIPPHYPPGTSPGEVFIFDKLARCPASWTILHSLHLPEHVRQVEGEADFVVLIPGRGVLCLEVKGHLQAEYRDGSWYLGARAGPDYRGPFRQAEEATRSIKRKVTSAFTGARAVLFWPAVIFTHCVPAIAGVTGEWHAWQLLTRDDLEQAPLEKLLLDVMDRARAFVAGVESARWFDPASNRPTVADCVEIRRLLRPDVHFAPALTEIRRDRVEEIRRFTDEQLEAIEGLDGVNARALVEGPAGTGKTVLAREEARRAAAAGQRVLLTCYNYQLGQMLKAAAHGLGLQVTVGTFHSVLRDISGDLGPASHPEVPEQQYWSRDLPHLALAALLDSRPPFDFLIVDEAQDLAEEAYLDAMDGLLAGGVSHGQWRMFADFERQSIYISTPEEALQRICARAANVARFRLRRNCRNTPRVAEYIVRLGGLDPAYSRILRPDWGAGGTPRTLFYRSQDNQAKLLLMTLDDLTGAKCFVDEDIVILSPLKDSCAAAAGDRLGRHGLAPLSSKGCSGFVRFGTIASFKGLEAPAVILTDIDQVGTAHAQRLFYVGVSRATDQLRVLARDGLQGAIAAILAGGATSG